MSQALDLRSLRETANKPHDEPDNLVSRDHVFDLSYDAPDGNRHSASITSRIMDGDERIDVARIAAQRAGVQWEMLPKAQAARIWAQSTLAVQLRDTPDWLSRWAVEDDGLLFACFDICAMHESEFFRNSNGEGTEGAKSSRIRVSSTLAAVTDRERA